MTLRSRMARVKAVQDSLWDNNTAGRRSKSGWQRSNLFNIFWRFIQLIMACVVIGYYGSDLNKARQAHKYSDSKWVFAVVVGSMAAITALGFILVGFFSQYRTLALLFTWEWLLVIFWSALTGLFGVMYNNENPEMDAGVQTMIIAYKCDVANLCLWGISAIVATTVFFKSPRKTLHTSRAAHKG